jgi:hypothetical protein
MGTDGDIYHKWVEYIDADGKKAWKQVETRFAGEQEQQPQEQPQPEQPKRRTPRLLFTGRKRQS